MPRVTDGLLGGKAFSNNTMQPVLDLTYGGQMGFSSNLAEWVNNANEIEDHVICLVLEAPKAFQNLTENNPDIWVRNMRSIFELHPVSISGLDSTLSVQTESTLVGGAGEIQEEPVDVKRAPSQPSFSCDEKRGRPVQLFFEGWITNLIMDPDSKIPNISTFENNRPTDMLPDQYTATCIFIEHNFHRQVKRAWLCTNMFPKSAGENKGSREKGAAKKLVKHQIEFSAITMVGRAVLQLAQKMLTDININNANPYLRPAFIKEVHPDVQNQGTRGYETHTEELGTAGSQFKNAPQLVN